MAFVSTMLSIFDLKLLILLTHPHFLERKALNMWGQTFVSGSIGAKFGYYITEIWAEPESDAVDIELPS